MDEKSISWRTAVCFLLLTTTTTQGLITPPIGLPAVLRQAGKTVFRPGGSAATKQLLGWVDAKNTMIRVISPCHNNMNDLQVPYCNTTVVLLEAILTHQPDSTKETILQSLSSEQLLLHDVCLLPNVDNDARMMIQQDMTHALGTGFYALSVEEWQQLVQRNGYRVVECQQGPLQQSMNPKRLIQEEGWRRALRIMWNLVTHPQWRERVRLARSAMSKYNENLGYMILRAVQVNNPTVESN